MLSRGFVAAALLIMLALSCIALLRALERDYRLLLKLRRAAGPPGLDAAQLSEEERDAARQLESSGVLVFRDGHYCLVPQAASRWKRGRVRLAFGAACGVLLFGAAVVFLLLRH